MSTYKGTVERIPGADDQIEFKGDYESYQQVCFFTGVYSYYDNQNGMMSIYTTAGGVKHIHKGDLVIKNQKKEIFVCFKEGIPKNCLLKEEINTLQLRVAEAVRVLLCRQEPDMDVVQMLQAEMKRLENLTKEIPATTTTTEKSLVKRVEDLINRCVNMENLAGNMLATLKLNYDKGDLLGKNQECQEGLAVLILRWRTCFEKLK